MNQQKTKQSVPRRHKIRQFYWISLLPLLFTFVAVLTIRINFWNKKDSPAETTSPAQTESATIPFNSEQSLSERFSSDDWRLQLVNQTHVYEEGLVPELTELMNGFLVDSRCYPDLQEMMDNCRAAGLSPLICSAYRTLETQQKLYENKITQLQQQGYSEEDAVEMAGVIVAPPGTSEHHLGLALDIVDLNYQLLDNSQEDTAVQRWLMEHSWEYGFVLRYPSDKSDVTGIIYEPWHYRYVGKDAAREIHEQGLCLEEFLELLGME